MNKKYGKMHNKNDTRVYNYKGEDISCVGLKLLCEDFGYVDGDNIPYIKWGEPNDACDANGFDKTYHPIPGTEVYVIDNYILPKGTIICRYGNPRGSFTTLKGSTYESLGLPYVKETIEYHEYEVTKDTDVDCYVTKGIAAPKFLSSGGGVQFMHRQSITLECEDGYLQEVFSWLQKNI